MLLDIPYGQIAKRLAGERQVARMSAQAVGHNPVSLIVPCHRVIGKDGSLTGYGGGLWRKEWLLQLENSVHVHYYRLSMRAAFFIALQNLPGRDFYWSRQEIPQLFRIQTVANIKLTPNQGFRKVQKLMVLLQQAYESRFIFVLPMRIQHEIYSGMSL